VDPVEQMSFPDFTARFETHFDAYPHYLRIRDATDASDPVLETLDQLQRAPTDSVSVGISRPASETVQCPSKSACKRTRRKKVIAITLLIMSRQRPPSTERPHIASSTPLRHHQLASHPLSVPFSFLFASWSLIVLDRNCPVDCSGPVEINRPRTPLPSCSPSVLDTNRFVLPITS
jgi:hypothetical protein